MKRWAVALGVTLLIFAAMTVFSLGTVSWASGLMAEYERTGRELNTFEVVVLTMGGAWRQWAIGANCSKRANNRSMLTRPRNWRVPGRPIWRNAND